MGTTTALRKALALGALATLGACAETATAPGTLDEDVIDQDVALLAADAATEDLAAMTELFPAGAATVPGEARLELVRSRTVDFYDAAGVLQEGYDPSTTAAIHTLLEVEGGVERMGIEMSLARTRDLWVTGLEGRETTRIGNGTGTEARSRSRISDEGGDRTYTHSGTLLIEDVVHGLPRDEFPWPLSGTITRTIQVERTGGPNGDRSLTRTVIVTFNGGSVVPMTVDGQPFELDLARRDRQRVRRRIGAS